MIAIAVLTASAAGAQRPDSVQIPLAGPGTLVGFVADEFNRPLAGAEVYISALQRSVFTSGDGSFRLDNIKEGAHQVGARKLGYYPAGQQVVVKEKGGATAFWLRQRSAVTLPTIVASAARGGLSGVVGDTAFNIIEGATIWAMATDRRAQSDSTGQFHLDLKPGRHMLRIERAGYGSKLVSVNIPRDSGRRVTVWLNAASPMDRRDNQALLEMSMRLTRRNPVWSKIYTREDFLESRMQTTDRFASAGAGKRVPEYCLAIVDGGRAVEPLWVIDLADVETMEVYTSRPPRGGARNPNAGGPNMRGVPQPRECDGTRVYVWLRK
jgi:hypothetical protein